MRPGSRALAVALVLVGGLGLPAGADDTVPDGTSPPTASNNAAAAQPLTVSGHVRTTAGAPIAGATVSGGEAQPATTDASGFYRLQFLTFGAKQVTATAPGMNSRSNLVALSLEQAVVDGNDYTLRYLTSVTLNRTYISTASGSFTLTQTLSTYAPASSCARVHDTRTANTVAVTLSQSGGQATGTYTAALAQGSPEGVFTLTSSVADCATGTQLDVGATTNYVVDNTAPVLTQPIPADRGNSTTPNPVISAYAGDNLAGIDPGSVAMTLDDAALPGSGAAVTPVGTGAVVSHGAQALGVGFHTVSVGATDRAGNPAVGLSWEFLVTRMTLSTAEARPDPASTASVPLAYAPGDVLPIDAAVQVKASAVELFVSAHPGFGLVCGTLDLATLRARFTKLDGSVAHVAPRNLSPATRFACSYVGVPDHDVTEAHRFLILGRSYAVGRLEFPIPTGAVPASAVPVVFEGPTSPAVQWRAPCVTVNAAPGSGAVIGNAVCDPVPNWLDLDTGTAIAKHLASRAVKWDGLGYISDGQIVLPSVWGRAGSGWALLAAPVDTGRLHAADPVSSGVTVASPYRGGSGGTSAVLYRVLDRWYKDQGSGNRLVATGSYFQWSAGFTGSTAGAGYLAYSWRGLHQRSSLSYSLFDQDGNVVSGAVDDAGRPVSWLAYDDPTYGTVVGFAEAFSQAGSPRSVVAGELDVVTADADSCAYCEISAQWFRVGDPGPQSFARRDPGPGLSSVGPASGAAVAEVATTASAAACLGVMSSPSDTMAARPPLCSGPGGSSDPDREDKTPPDTASWYVSRQQLDTYNSTSTCPSGLPQDLRGPGAGGPNCNVIWSMGYYAGTGGMHILFVGKPCLTGGGAYGVSLFESSPACTAMQTVVERLRAWLDGYAANPYHIGKVRIAIATNNSYPAEVVPELNAMGRDMYQRIWDTFRTHANRNRDAVNRNNPGRDLFFAVSGGMDVETPNDNDLESGIRWQEAVDTLPWVEGWNQQADAQADPPYKMNMYAASSLTVNFNCTSPSEWTCRDTTRNPDAGGGIVNWSAQDFWRVSWGKWLRDYNEDFSAPQVYDNTYRPANYRHLNELAVAQEVNPINHSAVLWDCTREAGTRAYATSYDAYVGFTTALRQWADAPRYRLVVHSALYSC